MGAIPVQMTGYAFSGPADAEADKVFVGIIGFPVKVPLASINRTIAASHDHRPCLFIFLRGTLSTTDVALYLNLCKSMSLT